MKMVLRLCLVLIALAAICVVVWKGLPPNRQPLNASEAMTTEQNRDPCWFKTLKDPGIPYSEIEKRNNREQYGYPADTPLSEAVRIFNEEKQCDSILAPYPPLTEDELIAAIAGGPDYGKQGDAWLAQKDMLWKIATQKILPKGSLLVAESGYRVQDSPLRPSGTIAAKGIRITLLLGLDKHDSHGRIYKPEETLIIRKMYSQVEIVQ